MMNRAALSASIDRAFEFSNATTANANQGGLFDMLGDDSHGSSTQEPELVEVCKAAWAAVPDVKILQAF
jgi:DNA polymerase-3 subunit alpha